MAENNSFVFYKSFYDAMQYLDSDGKSDFIKLICELAFEEKEPELDDNIYSPMVKIAYTIAAEQIKASLKNKQLGALGGAQKGVNNKNRGVNRGVNSPLNSNVNENVNVKDNVKVNVNVNECGNSLDTSSFIYFNNLKSFFIDEAGFNFSDKVLNLIIEKAGEFEDPESAIKSRLNYLNKKYADKSIDEKQGLFYSSLSWDITDETTEEPKEKKTKKQNLELYKTAPKVCDKCGGKVIKWAGVPNAVICKNCNTYWELDDGGGNVWKCSKE